MKTQIFRFYEGILQANYSKFKPFLAILHHNQPELMKLAVEALVALDHNKVVATMEAVHKEAVEVLLPSDRKATMEEAVVVPVLAAEPRHVEAGPATMPVAPAAVDNVDPRGKCVTVAYLDLQAIFSFNFNLKHFCQTNI